MQIINAFKDVSRKGLPTKEELKLIMRLSSNLNNDNLIELIKNLPSNERKYKKIYKLVN